MLFEIEGKVRGRERRKSHLSRMNQVVKVKKKKFNNFCSRFNTLTLLIELENYKRNAFDWSTVVRVKSFRS